MTTYFTKEQIKDCKRIAKAIYGDKMKDPNFLLNTPDGLKTNTGIINLILETLYGEGGEKSDR